jgi:hypothetical protein
MKVRFAAIAVSILAFAGSAMADYVPGAAMISPALTGNTQYDGWIGLSTVNYSGYGGFPGGGAWPAPIGSNRTLGNTFNATEPGDAVLAKVANGASGGGPFLSGTSIYFGSFTTDPNSLGGTVALADSTPVAGVRNVVAQIQIGEAFGFDFFNHVLPTLSYNGGAQSLAAASSTIIDQFYNGTFDSPVGPQPIYINTYVLQWDLTGVGAVTDFSIAFSGVQHSQIYGARVDQSDVFTPVPAPSALMIAGLGGLTALRRRR